METQYFGSIDSSIATAHFADDVLVGDVVRDADDLIAIYNARQQALLSLMGFRTTSPDADRVSQVKAKWQRFGEHSTGSMRTKVLYEMAVTTAIEGYEALTEYTRWSQVIAQSSQVVADLISGIVEENARFRYQSLYETFFTNAPRQVVDEVLGTSVLQLPFYYGDGDTRIPPPRGSKSFEAGHNHFLRTATSGVITTADLLAFIRHITEHGFHNQLIVAGNEATCQEILDIGPPDIAEFFERNPLVPTDSININQPGALATTSLTLAGGLYRAVGIFKGRTIIAANDEIPDGYLKVFSHEGPLSRFNSLQMRESAVPDLRGLRPQLTAIYPFVDQGFEDHFGVSVRQAGNGLSAQWIYDGDPEDDYEAPEWPEDNF